MHCSSTLMPKVNEDSARCNITSGLRKIAGLCGSIIEQSSVVCAGVLKASRNGFRPYIKTIQGSGQPEIQQIPKSWKL